MDIPTNRFGTVPRMHYSLQCACGGRKSSIAATVCRKCYRAKAAEKKPVGLVVNTPQNLDALMRAWPRPETFNGRTE